MAKLSLTGKELRKIGYPEGPVISVVINTMEKNYKHSSIEDVLNILKDVLAQPEGFTDDEVLGNIAKLLIPKPTHYNSEIALNIQGIHFNVFGSDHIENGAFAQMQTAAKLPVAVAGALMPDAHAGYGLPIGGVLATENAIIPYGVGVDIGCRMCLSIFDMPADELQKREDTLTRALNSATMFGSGAMYHQPEDHEVIHRAEFNQIPILRSLQGKAAQQLGTSGSGNHFAEFGIVEIEEADNILNVPAGKYIGLLTHSGSRALGANIANHYTKMAKEKRKLPAEASNLAWLNLDEAEGWEYWLAMNLAGDYASACHHVIHKKIAREIGYEPLKMVENHHNFAWKENWQGKEVIVHRKGATPAGKNVLGIIPGSMTAPGFIVKGRGETASLNSASHGAGRRMSRTQAMKTITYNALHEALDKHGVKLMGGGLDEAPFAYKDIETVMQSQQQLVDVIGKFHPKIVKMCGDAPKKWRKKKHQTIEGE